VTFIVNPFRFASSVSGPVLLSSDTFNRADGALGSTDGAGSVDPVAWSTLVGTGWQILGNRVYKSGAGFGVAAVELGASDVAVEIQIPAIHTSGNVGVTFRVQDASNYWVFFMSGNTNQATLGRVTDGTFAAQESVTVTKTAGDIYKVACVGNNIRRYINDVEVGTTKPWVSSSFATATKHGMWFNADVTWRLDNFAAYTAS
jgi:hypothetical protein